MKQHPIAAAIATLVLLFTGLGAAAFAQSNTVSERFPIDGTYYNECCDEYISFTGSAHVVTTTTTNGDGSVTVKQRVNVSGVKGTGLSSGISYNIMENGTIEYTYTPDEFYPYSESASITDRLVGKGRGGRECSAQIKITLNFALDEDGNVIVNDFDIDFICANEGSIE